MLAAVKHQMLKEMGKTGFPGSLILGAHMVPDVKSHDWSFVVFMQDDSQTVGQDMFFIRNVNFILTLSHKPGIQVEG